MQATWDKEDNDNANAKSETKTRHKSASNEPGIANARSETLGSQDTESQTEERRIGTQGVTAALILA